MHLTTVIEVLPDIFSTYACITVGKGELLAFQFGSFLLNNSMYIGYFVAQTDFAIDISHAP